MTTATDKSKAAPKEPEEDVDLTKIKASREITLKDKDLRSEDVLLLQADSPANPVSIKLITQCHFILHSSGAV